MTGILNIYKPAGITSHDVVNKIRKILNTKKVGHTGTLDPIAEGVLPICIGEATKISQFILEKDKEYIAEMKLGASTDTYDKTGEVINVGTFIPEKNEIENIITQLTGEIYQTPPMYSAIKVNGKKLYEYAREKKEVYMEPRKITINRMDLLDYKYPHIKILINCSKGTYIRSICHEIGNISGSWAHMTQLVRTKSGSFAVEDSVYLDNLTSMPYVEIEKLLYPMDYPLEHFNKVNIHIDSAKYLLNGNKLIQRNCIEKLDKFNTGELVRLYLQDQFKGMGEIAENQQIKPIRIFK